MKTAACFVLICLLISLGTNGQTKPLGGQNVIKKTAHPMETDQIKNEIVKQAIEALQNADKTGWFALFTTDARLYDDGKEMDFKRFFEKAIGHERFVAIDRVEDNGLAIYGKFHSDQWGEFKTYFRFHLDGKGKISRLNIGQANY